jgi:hypothetical protein
MTWHSFLHAFFDPSLKDLPIAYALVWIIQASYAGWITWNWVHTKNPRA